MTEPRRPSYSQNGEDILLWRALGHLPTGRYVDVGAGAPSDLSVTRLFYDHSWSGLNLEPEPTYFGQLTTERPRDVTLQTAAGATSGHATFHVVESTGLSTLDAEIARECRSDGYAVREITCEVAPLSDLIDRHFSTGDDVHFLKIDVEGSEYAALQGLDLERHRPWIVLIEATRPRTTTLSHQRWEPLLLESGYRFVNFDGINRYYVAEEHLELAEAFDRPVNALDLEQFETPSQRAGRERVEHVRRALEAQSAESTELRVRLADRDRELHETRMRSHDEIAEQQRCLDALREQMAAQLAASDARLGSLTKQLSDAATGIQGLRSEIEHLRIELTSARSRLELKDLELRLMRSSRSWRVTKPLRALGRLRRPAGLLVRAARHPVRYGRITRARLGAHRAEHDLAVTGGSTVPGAAIGHEASSDHSHQASEPLTDNARRHLAALESDE